MQRAEHLGGRLAAHRGGAERVTGERRHAGRARPLSDHVPDHQHPAAGLVVEHVVEVPADLVQLAGRRVQRAHLRARDLGQRFRQQRALQEVRYAGTLRVDAGPFHRRPRAPPEPQREAEVAP